MIFNPHTIYSGPRYFFTHANLEPHNNRCDGKVCNLLRDLGHPSDVLKSKVVSQVGPYDALHVSIEFHHSWP